MDLQKESIGTTSLFMNSIAFLSALEARVSSVYFYKMSSIVWFPLSLTFNDILLIKFRPFCYRVRWQNNWSNDTEHSRLLIPLLLQCLQLLASCIHVAPSYNWWANTGSLFFSVLCSVCKAHSSSCTCTACVKGISILNNSILSLNVVWASPAHTPSRQSSNLLQPWTSSLSL